METLKRKKDFDRLFNNGKSIASHYLVLYWNPNSEGENRYGFSISKRIGKAVVRNKLKRRLKEIIRKNIGSSKETSYDIMIIARKPVNNLDYHRLKIDLLSLFKKANLYRK